ncbi:hypothetical protein Ga0061062_11640 [Comamonas thiooxydans]|nr:hypothetical protein Ga0061062_11640 [Comamonas thiooxydans]
MLVPILILVCVNHLSLSAESAILGLVHGDLALHLKLLLLQPVQDFLCLGGFVTGKPIEAMDAMVHLLMDRAYEGDETHVVTAARNFVPVVPANPQRKQTWLLDKHWYR